MSSHIMTGHQKVVLSSGGTNTTKYYRNIHFTVKDSQSDKSIRKPNGKTLK